MNLKNKIEQLVINHFLNDNNNTAPAIDLKVNITAAKVNAIITKYLNTKVINE